MIRNLAFIAKALELACMHLETVHTNELLTLLQLVVALLVQITLNVILLDGESIEFICN